MTSINHQNEFFEKYDTAHIYDVFENSCKLTESKVSEYMYTIYYYNVLIRNDHIN